MFNACVWMGVCGWVKCAHHRRDEYKMNEYLITGLASANIVEQDLHEQSFGFRLSERFRQCVCLVFGERFETFTLAKHKLYVVFRDVDCLLWSILLYS